MIGARLGQEPHSPGELLLALLWMFPLTVLLQLSVTSCQPHGSSNHNYFTLQKSILPGSHALQESHGGCSPGAEAGMESAGSQQPGCCFLCDAQHLKAWGKSCWSDTKFFGEIHNSERASDCPALPLADLTACRSPSTMPRDTHITMTGSREGATLATLVSPGSSVRSSQGTSHPCSVF